MHFDAFRNTFDSKKTTILDIETNLSKRKTSEMFIIHLQKNPTNKIEATEKLHDIYTPFLGKIKKILTFPKFLLFEKFVIICLPHNLSIFNSISSIHS